MWSFVCAARNLTVYAVPHTPCALKAYKFPAISLNFHGTPSFGFACCVRSYYYDMVVRLAFSCINHVHSTESKYKQPTSTTKIKLTNKYVYLFMYVYYIYTMFTCKNLMYYFVTCKRNEQKQTEE